MDADGTSSGWPGRRLTGDGVFSGVDALKDPFSLFLVQCVIILTVCRFLGVLGASLKQPKVIFEIIGGILLGPSAIGRNKIYIARIFPDKSLPLISVVANLGLVLYLFIVGMELDPKLLATHARKAGAIAFMGMLVPFCLGIAISRTMFDTLQGSDPKFANVSFTSFFVFIGTAMSITAFPVLARILKEGGLIYTSAGSMAMGAAALNDAAAWCLLVLAISLANSANLQVALWVFLSVLAFAVVLLFIVRPLWWRLVYYIEAKNSASMNNWLFCFTLILVFLSSWTTALIGLDSIFGAFLFGLIMPRDSHLFRECNEKIEELVLSITLPLYFALSGLKTDVTQIRTTGEGAMVVLVCVVATAGKYIGAGSAAYFGGTSLRESGTVAALMNTRGLVELIVLNLGMNSGILNIKTFSVMVIMCLFTTFSTCPVVDCIYPVHMRTICTDKHLEVADEEMGGNSYSDDGILAEMTEASMGMIAQGARLGVIVDRMEHLQGIMDLMSLFIPYTASSKLTVTAIRVLEPSMSDKDTFIGLNGEGRLISIEEENTSFNQDGNSQVVKLATQELLSLSMFVKAVGGTMKAYRIRGDPKEFPQEIRNLTRKSTNLILFPWRASNYVERLFWQTLHTVTSPIALVVMLDTKTDHVGSATIGVDGGHLAIERCRAPSAVEQLEPIPGSSSAPPCPPRAPSATASPTASLRRTPSTVEGTAVDDVIPIRIDDRQSVCIRTVLVVVTGSATCCSVFPLALRFSERKSTEVTVLVTSDKANFEDSVAESLAAFRHSVEGIDNITIRQLTTSSTEIDAIVTDCAENAYDLLIFGHSCICTDPGTDNVPTPTLPRPHRSASITFAPQPHLDVSEIRRQSGVPDHHVYSSLAHPELGVLGTRISEQRLASFMMILHEPSSSNRQRRNTTWGAVPGSTHTGKVMKFNAATDVSADEEKI